MREGADRNVHFHTFARCRASHRRVKERGIKGLAPRLANKLCSSVFPCLPSPRLFVYDDLEVIADSVTTDVAQLSPMLVLAVAARIGIIESAECPESIL